jgi:hypothetical protein
VYNEKILDLFGDNTKPLRIGKDGFGLTAVKGINEFEIKTANDIEKVIQDINAGRRQCTTRFNAASSRSHCVFFLKLVTIPLDPRTGARTTDLSAIRCTRLSIVDLAGSERVSPSDQNSLAVTEACNINKSMLVLGRCIREIRKLNKGGSGQVPFRESKLTELFRDYFEPGGRSTMAAIIINISPSTAQFDDTLFSLQFAAEAVECNVRAPEDDSDDDFQIHTIDLSVPDEDTREVQMFAQIEAKIRREIHEDMADRLKRIQDDYQMQVDQIRAQSAQPYTSKLQMALAQRMQKESRSKELEECMRERDREKLRVKELESKLAGLEEEVSEVRRQLEEANQKNAMLEGNITKMIDATKKLHERHVKLQTELQEKAAGIEASWQRRVALLEEELAKLKRSK